MSLSRVYAAVVRGALLLIAFCVPIAVLPWASEPLEIHKQTITVVLTVVAALAWLGYVVSSKTLRLPKRALLLLPLVVVVAGLLSPGLRDSFYLSVVGQNSQEYTSLLSLLMFFVLAVLVSLQGDDHRLQRQLFSALILSGAVVSIYTALTIVGLMGAGMPVTPVGTVNSAAIYLLTMTALGSGLWLTSRGEGERDVLPGGAWGLVLRGAVLVTGVVTLLVGLSIDFSVFWIVVLATTASIMAFALVRAHEFPHVGRFFLPIALCVTSLVFLILPSPFHNAFPAEVGLSTSGTWRIAGETLRSPLALFGSGPGTFGFMFEQYRDPALAVTDFWDFTFDRGSSHVLTLLTTFGIVGALAHVLFIITLAILVFGKLAREKAHEDWKLTFAPAIAWFALALAQFVYPSTMTLSLLFWLLTGVLLGQLAGKEWAWNFLRSPRAALASAFLFVFMLVGLVTTLFVSGTRYAADIAFARALANDRANAPLDSIIADLDRAALTNRFSDTYYRNLGHALLLKTAEVLVSADADPQRGKDLVSASVNAALRATSLNRANVINWKVQGDVYREIAPLVNGADDYAVAAYQEAIRRSPANPKYYVALGRAYLVKADLASVAMESDDATLAAQAKTVFTNALTAAKEQFDAAIALRETYAPAQYFAAYTLERQGKITDAIASMEFLKSSDPYDVGVALQLGLLYLKQGKTAQAKAELERAVSLAPNYANAHWYLASIYEEQHDLASAMKEIEAVAELNPENAAVQQRLENLRDGLVASQLPDPLEETEAGATLPTAE